MPHALGRIGHRKVAIAVDLSDESAYAVRWAVANYLRPDDSVIILHVQPTNVLYGADWGAMDQSIPIGDELHLKCEDDFDTLTSNKAAELAKPIQDAHIAYKIHIVKDHDMKERICLEVERLGVNAVIMGSRGFGASKNPQKARLGSVSDYCVHHCDCPVVVVRYPEEEKDEEGTVAVSRMPAEGHKVAAEDLPAHSARLDDKSVQEKEDVVPAEKGQLTCLRDFKYSEHPGHTEVLTGREPCREWLKEGRHRESKFRQTIFLSIMITNNFVPCQKNLVKFMKYQHFERYLHRLAGVSFFVQLKLR